MVAMRDHTKTVEKMFKAIINDPQTIDRKTRTMRVVMTTRDADRVGDTVEPKGLNFTNYLKNPVVLWAHDMSKPPIGHVEAIDVYDNRVEAVVKFASTVFAKEIFSLYADGDLRAWSIGFLPTKRQYIEADEEQVKKDQEEGRVTQWGRVHIEEAEILELSAAPVPKNPYTLTKKIDNIEDDEVKTELGRNMVLFDALKPELPEYTQKAVEAYLEVLSVERMKAALGLCALDCQQRVLSVADGRMSPRADTTLAPNAFSKSMVERIAKGKIPTVIEKTKDVDQAGTLIEFEPIQTEEIEGKTLIKEAKVLRVIVKMYEAEVTPEGEGRTEGDGTPATPEGQGRTDDTNSPATPQDAGRADADEEVKAISEAEMWAEDEKMCADFQKLTAELVEV